LPEPASADDLTLHVDESIYHKTAVLRACYWFTDRCYIFVERSSRGILAIRFTAKDGASQESLHTIEGEFTNALLDFELRRQIDEQTGQIRELIVAKALAEAGTLDDEPPPGTANDPVDDLRLATPLVQLVKQQ
jgi:His-Xaa-Ser system protein HxsD